MTAVQSISGRLANVQGRIRAVEKNLGYLRKQERSLEKQLRAAKASERRKIVDEPTGADGWAYGPAHSITS